MATDPVNLQTFGSIIAQIYEGLENTNKFTDEDKWKVSQLLVPAVLVAVTADDIANRESDLNQIGKTALGLYFDTTNSRVMIPLGATPGADWVNATGAISVTPATLIPASQIVNDTPQTDEEYADFSNHFIMGGLHANQF